MKFPMICAVCAAFLATAAPAASDGDMQAENTVHLTGGTLTYEVFEAAIGHVDLPGCPQEFDADKMFCRMTVASDFAHVFVFEYGGDQPLHAIKSYALDGDFLPF